MFEFPSELLPSSLSLNWLIIFEIKAVVSDELLPEVLRSKAIEVPDELYGLRTIPLGVPAQFALAYGLNTLFANGVVVGPVETVEALVSDAVEDVKSIELDEVPFVTWCIFLFRDEAYGL